MSDRRDAESDDESEWGLGLGMIDETLRADGRDALPGHMLLWEIYALPKSFDGSFPDRPSAEETPVPRLLPDETETDRP